MKNKTNKQLPTKTDKEQGRVISLFFVYVEIDFLKFRNCCVFKRVIEKNLYKVFKSSFVKDLI